jgi:hypothetical protein
MSREPHSNESSPAVDPFWVTSQFSKTELDGHHVLVAWQDSEEAWGVYRMQIGTYGHSKHIQSIHAVLVNGAGIPAFDFDQADADLLHRTNERIKEYSFVARLDPERPRLQNPLLEKLVRERRMHKVQDVEDSVHWETLVDPVVKPIVVSRDPYTLSLEGELEH